MIYTLCKQRLNIYKLFKQSRHYPLSNTGEFIISVFVLNFSRPFPKRFTELTNVALTNSFSTKFKSPSVHIFLFRKIECGILL